MSPEGIKIFETIAYAFFAGLLPALIWFWFWLHEDRKNPEPRKILALTFTTGMAMVFFALFFEGIFRSMYGNPITAPPSLMIIWVIIEELLKFTAAFIAALHTRHYDEPIDAVIYLICAALGFAALENSLFILQFFQNNPQLTVPSGSIYVLFMANMRFIGANLLHVLASSAIGVAIGYSFKKNKKEKILWTVGGIIIAILLHTAFNLFIMSGSSNGIFFIFLLVWLAMIGLLLVFEKIKRTSPLIS